MSASQLIKIKVADLGMLDQLNMAGPEAVFGFEALGPKGPWNTSDGLEVKGRLFSGRYDEVINALENEVVSFSALIVMFTQGVGMETFLSKLHEHVGEMPMVGGASAREIIDGRGVVMPDCEDVAVLALTGDGWHASTVTFHEPTQIIFEAVGAVPRNFTKVMYEGVEQDALTVLNWTATSLGIDRDSFWDELALISDDGRMLHMSLGEQGVNVSANLPECRELTVARFNEDYGRAQMKKHTKPGSLIFGCAGLHGLIKGERPWEVDCSTSYIYGEIVSPESCACFANLSVGILNRL